MPQGPQKTVQVRKTDDPAKKLETLWDADLTLEKSGDSSRAPERPLTAKELETPAEEKDETLDEGAQSDDTSTDDTTDEVPAEDETTEQPDASDEVEEATDETDATDEDQQADADAEETPKKRARKLKIDGKEVVVTEDEAYNGFMMQKDYTRKTQALAEREKALETTDAELRGTSAQYLDRLGKLDSALEALSPEAPDWESERKRLSPTEYAQRRDDWDRLQAKRKVIADERARVLDQEAKAMADQRSKLVEAETNRLLTAIPEWRDEKKFTTGMSQVVNFLHQSLGVPMEEIAQIADHRLILIARDAMRFRQATGALPKPKGKPVSSIRPAGPGAKPAAPKKKDEKATALAALRKSRGNRADNLRAGAEAMKHFLND